tara:strand:- start:553 stop:1752 length:1200 start_codon:yes stop_codon:yes gene_type:complete
MLDQSVVDSYLRCPKCYSEGLLKYNRDEMICNNCGSVSKVKFGIPALLGNEEVGIGSNKFLGLTDKVSNLYKKRGMNPFRRVVGQELMHFFNFIYFTIKFGVKKILKQKYCHEVERALYGSGGWKNYFNLILKSGEIYQFNRMKKYIVEPSLEIGCSDCATTNMIFKENVEHITFGCEYFMDGFLNVNDRNRLSDGMYKVIKNYVGGSIKSLPFRSSIFASLYMVHIIDHIVNIAPLFNEINRILKPGGYFVMSSFSKNVFENLPGVKLLKLFSSRWSENYKEQRVTRNNPRGSKLKSNYEFDATGQNLFSIEEWREIAEKYGFEVIDYAFFGKYFSHFMDIECRGYYNSKLFNKFIYAAISEMVDQEKINPLLEKESTQIILVLKKVKNIVPDRVKES